MREARALAERGVRELLLISQDTTFFGIDRGERGALGRLLRELNRIEGLTWIRLLYLYPTTITDDVLDGDGGMREGLPLHRSASATCRLRTYSSGCDDQETGRPTSDCSPGFGTAFLASPSARRSSSAFPARPTRTLRSSKASSPERGSTTSASSRIRTRKGHGPISSKTTCRPLMKRRRRNALMARQKRIVAQAQKARIGSEVEVMVDGPSPEHDLVLQGRLEGQAPDIDAVVYLTDFDPEVGQAGAARPWPYRRGRGTTTSSSRQPADP